MDLILYVPTFYLQKLYSNKIPETIIESLKKNIQ